MNENSSQVVRQLIRLANDRNLDSSSRNAICAMAQYVRNLQKVSSRVRELDTKLKEFKCAYNLNQTST